MVFDGFFSCFLVVFDSFCDGFDRIVELFKAWGQKVRFFMVLMRVTTVSVGQN